MTDNEDRVIIFEAPKIIAPEFRLYYNDKGEVICYTCQKLEGDNFIIIDARTYAEARPDVKVIDGKISRKQANAVVYKLMPSLEGTLCATDDISVIVDDRYKGNTTNWKLNIYEL